MKKLSALLIPFLAMSTDAEELRAVTRIVESLISRTDSGNNNKNT